MQKQIATSGIKVDKIFNLSDGDHFFEFKNAPHEIGLHLRNFEDQEVFSDEVVTKVKLSKTLNTYYLEFTAETTASFYCDRCLDPVLQNIEGEYAFGLKNVSGYEGSEEMRPMNTNQNEVRLDEDVCNALLLTLPRKILCRQDCKGLCDQCGANLNTEQCAHQ